MQLYWANLDIDSATQVKTGYVLTFKTVLGQVRKLDLEGGFNCSCPKGSDFKDLIRAVIFSFKKF